MKSSYNIDTYESGAKKIYCNLTGITKLIYSNKDSIYTKNEKTIAVRTYYGAFYLFDEYYESEILLIDNFGHNLTIEAERYINKKIVLRNIKSNPKYYDELITVLFKTNPSQKDQDIKITEDVIATFFDLPKSSIFAKVSVRTIGIIGFDVCVSVALNPALQDRIADELDILFSENKNSEWLIEVCGWRKNYQVGISTLHFSAFQKDGNQLIQKWLKSLEKKIGKQYLTIET